DVVLVPGRAGGTNAILSRDPAFRTDYHGTSYLDHLDAAAAVGASVSVVDSYRLSTDVDEPADLLEVLLHGQGSAPAWLRDHGITIDRSGSRVSVERSQ
ncbi:MAG: 2-phospho-L-lactate guanylyltransferase, partial [Halobacteriales archaeon]|nr:2-phospho-L-lactate guanylyltransferase [Halobacteriales archaeon]